MLIWIAHLFSSVNSRAAMMEFEINMTEMPLGKLSKQNIQKGTWYLIKSLLSLSLIVMIIWKHFDSLGLFFIFFSSTGFEALTEIQNLLSDNSYNDPAFKESMLVAASNRFFTLIPSVHPHIIRDEFDFKAKVCSVLLYTCVSFWLALDPGFIS